MIYSHALWTFKPLSQTMWRLLFFCPEKLRMIQDITSAESKATYQEIKDYVLKEFGLKVSILYISQIKRKCGIEVGEHYNVSQKENQKVPQCPKEKEDAIRSALEHFAMI